MAEATNFVAPEWKFFDTVSTSFKMGYKLLLKLSKEVLFINAASLIDVLKKVQFIFFLVQFCY